MKERHIEKATTSTHVAQISMCYRLREYSLALDAFKRSQRIGSTMRQCSTKRLRACRWPPSCHTQTHHYTCTAFIDSSIEIQVILNGFQLGSNISLNIWQFRVQNITHKFQLEKNNQNWVFFFEWSTKLYKMPFGCRNCFGWGSQQHALLKSFHFEEQIQCARASECVCMDVFVCACIHTFARELQTKK